MEKVKIKKGGTVLFLGDSITDVFFNFRFMSSIKGRNVYALQIKKYLKKVRPDVKVVIKGTASDRTYHLYDRLTKDCMKYKPDVVVMLIGVNDAWERYVPEQYPAEPRDTEPHFRELFRRFSQELPGTRIIYLMPFMINSVPEKLPFRKKLDEFRQLYRSIAEEKGAYIIDLQQLFDLEEKRSSPKSLATDGIHPTNNGHRIIAEAVKNIIDTAL